MSGMGRGKAGVNRGSGGRSHDRTAGTAGKWVRQGWQLLSCLIHQGLLPTSNFPRCPCSPCLLAPPPHKSFFPAPITLALTIANDVHNAWNVPCCVEDDAVGGLAVPPRPSCLLEVPLQALGQGVVHLGSSTRSNEHGTCVGT